MCSRSGATWASGPKLAATDGAANDLFGFSVGLSGTTAAIGAFERNATRGAAYVFTNDGGSWTQQELAGPSVALLLLGSVGTGRGSASRRRSTQSSA